MYKRLFPRMAFCLTLITSFLFMPISAVYADGYNQDSEYWRWWYVEQITDQMTEGQGASADEISDTYNGSTVGQYVYDKTGLTADDVKEYVQQQYDNATGYVEHTVEWYSSAIDDIWQSSIDVGTKAKYQAEKALRETVDTAGNTVVNVSSSGYWNNVYNDFFNNGSYNDQYTQGESNGNSFNTNGVNCSISYVGYGRLSGNVISELNSYTNAECYSSYEPNVTNPYQYICSISCNGYNGYFAFATIQRNPWYDDICYGRTLGFINNDNNYYFNYQYQSAAGIFNKDASIMIYGNITDITDNSTPILEPKQVGFVLHNGIQYPVYTDPSLNPFKVNDNGTVTFEDGDEPIYINPKELTPTGWMDVLENVDNDDQTQNPYNPQGQPWNTQPDGSTLGGFFSNLVKDISSIFGGIGKLLTDLIDKIIKAIKSIADLIVNALKNFWDLLIGDIEGYTDLFETDVDNHFTMISDLYDLLLECMGVDA